MSAIRVQPDARALEGKIERRPSASVIVLAYNAEQVIQACLGSLRKQDFAEPFEVIVVWSGQDGVPRIVERELPEAKVVGRRERLLTGATRNLGLEHASSDIIAFLAADCQAAPDWLRRRVAAHRSGFNCVGGAVLCAEPAGAVARANHLLEYSEFMVGRPREVVVGRPIFNVSFRREIFDRYGRYEAALACGEDGVFNWRLAQAGEPFLFDPDIRMFHPGPTGLRDFLKHQIWHGEGIAKLCQEYEYAALQGYRAQPLVQMLVAYPVTRITRLLGR